MTRRHAAVANPGAPIDGYGYGFGLLRMNGHETFGHNGGTPGASCQLDLLHDPELSILVLTNGDGDQRRASSILRKAVLPGA